jgi:repressor LexA
MNEITERQHQVLEFIRNYQLQKGQSPKLDEIADHFQIKAPSVIDHLKRLEEKGILKRDRWKPRGIEILDGIPRLPSIKIPLVGHIAAGRPIFATENIESYEPFQIKPTAGEVYFALRVQGHSMVNAHICHGDIVAVRQQTHADDGDIVAVLIGEEATLKYLHRFNDKVELRSANERIKPIIVDRKRTRVLGKVVALKRSFGETL